VARVGVRRDRSHTRSSRFTIASGDRSSVRVNLSRAGRKLVNRRGRVDAKAIATATDSQGNVGQSSRRITVRTKGGASGRG
jgi:hypothetical protein